MIFYINLILKKPFFKGDYEIEQIYKIFSILGTPHNDIWPEVTSLPNYQLEFPQFNGVDLCDIFTQLDVNGIHLLSSMLRYDPNKRITAKEALLHVRYLYFIF